VISGAVFTLAFILSFKEVILYEKRRPFECGFLSHEETRSPFSIQFFLVRLIFLVFDVELILLFPYLTRRATGCQSAQLVLFMFFLGGLRFGLFLEWEKTILE
jgi:NADH:ubiquinone oxidoreductase subunit 3 (subunit A)